VTLPAHLAQAFSWKDVKGLTDRLDAATAANVEPSTRLAGVTKEAAKLNAAVAETSSNAMLAAAQSWRTHLTVRPRPQIETATECFG